MRCRGFQPTFATRSGLRAARRNSGDSIETLPAGWFHRAIKRPKTRMRFICPIGSWRRRRQRRPMIEIKIRDSVARCRPQLVFFQTVFPFACTCLPVGGRPARDRGRYIKSTPALDATRFRFIRTPPSTRGEKRHYCARVRINPKVTREFRVELIPIFSLRVEASCVDDPRRNQRIPKD